MPLKFKAKINTKSNYRNLNGSWLPIIQFLGPEVSCRFTDEDGIKRTTTFNLNEIKSIEHA